MEIQQNLLQNCLTLVKNYPPGTENWSNSKYRTIANLAGKNPQNKPCIIFRLVNVLQCFVKSLTSIACIEQKEIKPVLR